MIYEVRLSRRARRELALIRAWWKINRPAAPDLIDDELADVRDLLAEQPTAGAVASDPDLAGVRRVVMRRSSYLVFYRIDEDAQQVEILTIWHARRQKPSL